MWLKSNPNPKLFIDELGKMKYIIDMSAKAYVSSLVKESSH